MEKLPRYLIASAIVFACLVSCSSTDGLISNENDAIATGVAATLTSVANENQSISESATSENILTATPRPSPSPTATLADSSETIDENLSASNSESTQVSESINVVNSVTVLKTSQTYPSAAWTVETPLLSWGPDSEGLAYFEVGSAFLRDVSSGAVLNTVEVYGPAFITSPENSGVTYLPNGDAIAWYHFSGTIFLKNLLTGSDLSTLKGFSLKWSPDGSYVAVANDHDISIIETANYTTEFMLLGHTNTIRDISWKSDSMRLASGSSDGTIRVWDISQAQEVLVLESNQDEVTEVSWSFDGNLLASVGSDAIQFWETTTGVSLGGLLLEDPGRGTIQRVHWSPVDNMVVVRTGITGRVLLFEAPDGMSSLIDIANGVVIGEIAWHPAGHTIAYFASTVPDLNQLHSVRFWDVQANTEKSNVIEPYQINNGSFDPNTFTYLNSMAWSPNGTWLALGGNNATGPRSSEGVIWLASESVLGLTLSEPVSEVVAESPDPTLGSVTSSVTSLDQLCLQWRDLDSVAPIAFADTKIASDRSLVGLSESIYHTFYGASDTVFQSIESASHPYIPDEEGAAYSISCSLTAYPDNELAEHAIALTTLVDFYSIPSSDYCPENRCLAVAMAERPIEYLTIPDNTLSDDAVVFRYAKMLTGPNISLLARYENIVLRLNIDPWDNTVTTEVMTVFLTGLAERIMGRVVESFAVSDFSPEIPELQCTLWRDLGSCLIEILAVQLRLQQLGYAQVGEADGIFGPMTEQAVIDFQSSNGLEADGIVGPETWARLFDAEALAQQ